MIEFGLLLQSRGDPGAVEYFRKAALNKNAYLGSHRIPVNENIWKLYVICIATMQFCAVCYQFAARKGFALLADVFERGKSQVHVMYSVTQRGLFLWCCQGELGIPKNPEEAAKLRNFGAQDASPHAPHSCSKFAQIDMIWYDIDVLLEELWIRRPNGGPVKCSRGAAMEAWLCCIKPCVSGKGRQQPFACELTGLVWFFKEYQ